MSTKTVKGYKGMGMEGPVARWYAQITRKKLDDYKKAARRITEEISPSATVLEIAPGPGYLSVELARSGAYRVTGLDISNTFVQIAQANANEAGVQVDFRQGDAAHMPFADNSFDFIICQAAFKNFAEPVLALDEMYRVLKPGGKARIEDLRGDVSPETVDKHVNDELHLKGINALMTRWAFRFMLIRRAYTKDQFTAMVARSKFKTCRIVEDSIGLEVNLEK